MNAEQCRQWQSEFLAGFEAKLAGRAELPLPGGTQWLPVYDLRRVRRYEDQAAELRRLVAESPNLDRARLDQLPLNPMVAIEFRRRLLLREVRLLAVAAVCVADTVRLARGESVGPAGPEQVRRALESLTRKLGYTLGRSGAGQAPQPDLNLPEAPLWAAETAGAEPTAVPLLVGVFSPTGWTDDAVTALSDDIQQRVALVTRNPDGTWSVREREPPSGAVRDPSRPSPLVDVFDPESDTRKLMRTLEAVRAEVANLPSGEILDASDLAGRFKAPARLVGMVLDDLPLRQPDLRTIEAFGRRVIYRLPPHAQPPSLLWRVWPFARRFIRADLMCEQRARLQIYRRQVWQELDNYARQELQLLEAGRRTESETERRRLATQLVGVRRELRHRRRLAELTDHQIAVLSTHLHHVELLALGRLAATAEASELRVAADQAQELLNRLADDARAAEEAVPDAQQLSAEEEAILREFDAPRLAKLEAERLAELERLTLKTEELAAPPTSAPFPARSRDNNPDHITRANTETDTNISSSVSVVKQRDKLVE